MNGQAPYSLLFNGLGSTRDFPAVIEGYFQTMELYEFLSDRFLYIFFQHNFGTLLYKSKSKIFKPELVIAHSMGFGTLQNPDYHLDIDFKTMEKGYLESGLMINNLLRFNYLNADDFGLGAGVYFRYGAYANDTFGRNVYFRLSTSFSF